MPFQAAPFLWEKMAVGVETEELYGVEGGGEWVMKGMEKGDCARWGFRWCKMFIENQRVVNMLVEIGV